MGAKFGGARPGYVFKLGKQGLGYYVDTHAKMGGGRGLGRAASRPPPGPGVGMQEFRNTGRGFASKRNSSESRLIPGGRRTPGSHQAFSRAGGKLVGLS